MVSGRVQLPYGAEASRSKIAVRLLKSFGVIPDCLMAPSTPNGDFLIPDVPPGTYVLWVSTLGIVPDPGQFFGYMPLQIAAADRRDLVVSLKAVRPVDVAGKVAFEGGAAVQPVFIGLQCSIRQGASAVSNQDGSFVVEGLLPGHYMIYIGRPSDMPGPGASGLRCRWDFAAGPADHVPGALSGNITQSAQRPAIALSKRIKTPDRMEFPGIG
jgi:hypothetical protein